MHEQEKYYITLNTIVSLLNEMGEWPHLGTKALRYYGHRLLKPEIVEETIVGLVNRVGLRYLI